MRLHARHPTLQTGPAESLTQDKPRRARGYQRLRPLPSSRRIIKAFEGLHRESGMKALRAVAAAAVLLAGLVAAVPASAHGYYHGHRPYYGHYYGHRSYWYGPSVRFYYGGPYWWGGVTYGAPYGYWPPYGAVYAPPPVVTVPAPPVYIERSADPAPAPSAAPAGEWWYLCTNPRGAYPYVRECPGGWERVPAVPPGQPR
jgi:hypothetical protein